MWQIQRCVLLLFSQMQSHLMTLLADFQASPFQSDDVHLKINRSAYRATKKETERDCRKLTGIMLLRWLLLLSQHVQCHLLTLIARDEQCTKKRCTFIFYDCVENKSRDRLLMGQWPNNAKAIGMHCMIWLLGITRNNPNQPCTWYTCTTKHFNIKQSAESKKTTTSLQPFLFLLYAASVDKDLHTG